jgi:hypothetical protein
LEDIDEIIMSRLQKNKDENKFLYLFQSFKRIESHLYVKEKIIENALDLKETVSSYFLTCLQCPESFNLPNLPIAQMDSDGGNNMSNMFMNMMGGMGGPESLASGQQFTFTTMQNLLWEAVEKESFI